jgi:hypothetical protein
MTLAQGISWHMYYGISLMALLAGRDMTMNRISWTALGVGYFLTNSVVGFSTKLFPGDDTGIPATCGLILMAATLLTQVRIRPVDENVGPPANAAS